MKKIFILPILLSPCVASSASVSIFYDANGVCDDWCSIPYDGDGCCPAESQVDAENLRLKIAEELSLRDEDFNGFTTSEGIGVFDTSGNFLLTTETARNNNMGATGGKTHTNIATTKCKTGYRINSHESCVDDNATYVDDNGFVIDPDDVEIGRGGGEDKCFSISDFQVRFHPVPTNERNNLPNPVYGYFGGYFHPDLVWPSGVAHTVNQFANQSMVEYPFDPAKDTTLENLSPAVPLKCNPSDGCITLYHCGDTNKHGSAVGWYDNSNCTGNKITELDKEYLPNIAGYTLRGYYGYTFNYMGQATSGQLAPLYIIPDIVAEKNTIYGATYAKRFVYNTDTQMVPLGPATLKVKKCDKQFYDGVPRDDTLNEIVVDVFGGWARNCENAPGLHRDCTLGVQQTTSGAYDAGDVKYTNVCHDGYKLADGDPGNKYNSRCELDSENISYEYNYQLMNENGSLSKITTCTGPDSDACTIGVDWSLPNSNTVSCPGYTFAQWLTFGGYHDAGVSVACSVAELGSGSPVAIAGIMCDCQRTNYCNSASSGRTRICINACGQDCTSPRDLQPGFTVDEDLGG